MAGCTKLVPLELEACRVGIVTVGTANSLVIHLALQERSKNIDLFHDLAVVMVERRSENGVAEMIVVALARNEARVDHPPVRMAGSTTLDLVARLLSFQLSQAISMVAIPEN